jgi:predicted ATPase
MHFVNVKVEGYRCLRQIDLELRPLNVFVGANGSGKSSLLEVFHILASGARGRLSRALAERGGLAEMLTVEPDGRARQCRISLATDVEARQPLSYDVTLAPRGVGHQIASEVLSPYHDPRYPEPFKWIDNRPGHPRYHDPQRQALVAPTWDYDEGELALAQGPKIYPIADQFRSRLAGTEGFGIPDTRRSAPARLPQGLEPGVWLPGANAETLVSALYNCRTDHPERLRRIVEAVQAAYPDLRGIDFPLAAAGKATFVWQSERFPARGFYPHEISDGMLRLLWLATLLLSPQLPTVITLDEPEVSLHPRLLKILAGLLQEASERAQVLVATHSAELLRWLAPDEIVLVDMEDGFASMRRATHPAVALDLWLKDYTLDELWLSGQLGACP